jgi:threonine/homoserine/homoserine lactone efflux protein
MTSSGSAPRPNWSVIRRVAFAGVLVGLVGVVLLIVGSEQLGAWFVVLGVVGALFLPWLGLIFAGAKSQRRYRPSREAAVRNSDLGFVAGLWNEAGRLQRKTERAGPRGSPGEDEDVDRVA